MLAIAATLLGASAASAQGLSLGADAGYTRVLNGDGANGFGLNVYGGYALDFGLVPELQVGFHNYSVGEGDFSYSMSFLPIQAGARYVIDLGAPVKPFAGAHIGITMGMPEEGDSSTDLSFNVGAGANYMIADNMGLGLAIWYWMVMSGGSEEVAGITVDIDNASLLTAGLNFNMVF
jgi:opacity protein-like surface antigen